jgi:hypothetical protein
MAGEQIGTKCLCKSRNQSHLGSGKGVYKDHSGREQGAIAIYLGKRSKDLETGKK